MTEPTDIGEDGGVDLDNVVSLTARHVDLATTPPLATKGYPCTHYPVALVVDCETRTVECTRCRANLDAFDAIYLLARHQGVWSRVEHAKVEAARIEQRIAEKRRTIKQLDAEVAKLRRTVKREGTGA